MNSQSRRIPLAPGYLLHHRPYRETGRILEVLARDHGRLTLFARGVSGPKSRLAAVLQPFQPLLLSFHLGRDAGQLSGAECAENLPGLPPKSLMAAFYLNELLLKLTSRHDPAPELFDDYRLALERLRAGASPEPTLRLFERRLLANVGYGVMLSAEIDGRAIDAGGYYRFRPSQGLYRVMDDGPGVLSGRSLLALDREELAWDRALADARILLKAALDECLEGRELSTRGVARAVARGVHPQRESQ